MRTGAHITRGLLAALFLSATALAHGSGTGTGSFGIATPPSFTDQLRRLQNFVDNEVPTILRSDRLSDQDRSWYQRLADLRNKREKTPEETQEYEQKLNYLAGEFAKHDPQDHREQSGGGTGGDISRGGQGRRGTGGATGGAGPGGGGASGAGASEQEMAALKKGFALGMIKALQTMPPQGQGQEKKEGGGGGGGGGGSSGGGGAPAGSGAGGELGGAKFRALATTGIATTKSPSEGGLKISTATGPVTENGKPATPKTFRLSEEPLAQLLRTVHGVSTASGSGLGADEPPRPKGQSPGGSAPSFFHQ